MHVSPDGKHLAAITRRGLLYLIRDFELLYQLTADNNKKDLCDSSIHRQSESTIFDNNVLRIDLASPATCMTFEFGRVLVQTVSKFTHYRLDEESILVFSK